MNAVQAKRALVISMTGTAGYVVVSRAMAGKWPTDPKLWVSLATMFVVLGFAADFAPGVVGPFAILILLGVLLYDQGNIFTGLTNIKAKARRSNMKVIRGGRPTGPIHSQGPHPQRNTKG